MDASVAIAKAQLLVETGRYRAALDLLSRHPQLLADNASALCLSAKALLGVNEAGPALLAAEAALRIDPSAEWAHRLCSLACLELRMAADAYRHALAAVRLEPDNWRTHLQVVHVEIATGDVGLYSWDTADILVELAPDEPSARLARGLVALHLDDLTSARAEFERVLALEPDHSDALNNLAVVALKRSRLQQATRGFMAAGRLDPRSSLPRQNLGVVARRALGLAQGGLIVASAATWLASLSAARSTTGHVWTVALAVAGVASVAFVAGRVVTPVGRPARRAAWSELRTDRRVDLRIGLLGLSTALLVATAVIAPSLEPVTAAIAVLAALAATTVARIVGMSGR